MCDSSLSRCLRPAVLLCFGLIFRIALDWLQVDQTPEWRVEAAACVFFLWRFKRGGTAPRLVLNQSLTHCQNFLGVKTFFNSIWMFFFSPVTNISQGIHEWNQVKRNLKQHFLGSSMCTELKTRDKKIFLWEDNLFSTGVFFVTPFQDPLKKI